MLRTGLIALAAAAGAIALSACSATMHTTQGGTYVYEQPWLETIEHASLDRTWQATQDAIADLEFTVDERAKDSLQAKLTSKQASGTTVRVDLLRMDDDSTKVRIKVGAFGDREVAELVLNKIRARIAQPRPAAQSEGQADQASAETAK